MIDGLDPDVTLPPPSVDRGDMSRSDFPEVVDAEWDDDRLSLAASHLDRLRCQSFSHASRLTSGRANILARV